MKTYVYAGVARTFGMDPNTPMEGVFRLDVDTGRWDSLTEGLPDKVEVRCLAIHPGSPPVLYAGTQSGPYRSTDGGDTWTALELPGRERLVWSLLIHPKDPQTIYAGTQGTTIYRSRDGGASWRELSPPAPHGMVKMSFPCRVIRLVVDPNRPDDLYAALEVGGVMRSRDGGDTWQGCNDNLLEHAEQPRLKSRIVSDSETEGMMDSHALAISRVHQGTVFLANRMGLFRSDDSGGRWTELGIGRFSPLTYARDVCISPHDPKTMYAALSVAAVSDAGSLYRSHDLGESWQRFDHGVSIDSTLMIIAPSASNPDRVWCAARRGQVFGTEDGGKTWQQHRLPGGVEGIYALATA
jgi:photosystem II stability/assembly factor-like uncharacterized protein